MIRIEKEKSIRIKDQMSELQKKASKANRNHFIDILKGICIIFVIVTHFSWTADEKLKYYFPFWINMAVPLFMIISGYVYAFSYKKHNIKCTSDAYELKGILSKMVRYTVPFAIAFAIEIGYMVYAHKMPADEDLILRLIKDFMVGGYGPGSYYFPLMIQFIFIYPIIYFIVTKYEFKGVLLIGLLNALFELMQCAYCLNYTCYRLLIFRYILLIAVGCCTAQGKVKQHKLVLLISFVIGLIFIYNYNYLEYEPKIVTHWTKTSFVACLYIIPLAVLMLSYLGNVRFAPLEYIGKASYNIFLTQMVWYHFGFRWLEKVISDRLTVLAVDIAICVVVGIIFYYLEKPITGFVDRKASKLVA